MNLKSEDTTVRGLKDAAALQLPGQARRIIFLLAAVAFGGAASGQIAVPKYQSPFGAPSTPATLPAPTPVTNSGATVVEYPVARINDQIIDNSDYERADREMVEEARSGNVNPAELEQARKDLLRELIDQQLLLSRAKELDINVDTDVIRELDEIRKQHKFDTMEDLEKAVRDSGVSLEDYKAHLKNEIIMQRVERDEVGRKLTLTAKDEQAYYELHKQDYALPEQVRLSEILIATADDATDAQVAQAKAKADQVVEKLKAGAKFEDLTKQYSGGPNPELGGDLGVFPRGALGSKALEDPTFALQAGQWTAPIRTRQGFVVLEVTEHTQAGIPPLSAVEDRVEREIYDQAEKPARRTYLTGLREKAFISVAPGFVDTGASPGENKTLFADATPPPVKKKKVVQKERLERNRAAVAAPARAAVPVKPVVASTPSATADAAPHPGPASARVVKASATKKPKKPRREKIRYGQAPQKSLPVATSTAEVTANPAPAGQAVR